MRKDVPMFSRTPDPNGSESVHPVFGTAYGFCPDLMTEAGAVTQPEASATVLEQQKDESGNFEVAEYDPPYGREGMMPVGRDTFGRLQPGLEDGDEGVGGAGSFLTQTAFGAKSA